MIKTKPHLRKVNGGWLCRFKNSEAFGVDYKQAYEWCVCHAMFEVSKKLPDRLFKTFKPSSPE